MRIPASISPSRNSFLNPRYFSVPRSAKLLTLFFALRGRLRSGTDSGSPHGQDAKSHPSLTLHRRSPGSVGTECNPLSLSASLLRTQLSNGDSSYFLFGSTFGSALLFVISGFLITHLLRIELERTSHISLRNFYIRRVLRIFPPMYLYLGIVVLLKLLGEIPLGIPNFIAALFFFRITPVFSARVKFRLGDRSLLVPVSRRAVLLSLASGFPPPETSQSGYFVLYYYRPVSDPEVRDLFSVR